MRYICLANLTPPLLRQDEDGGYGRRPSLAPEVVVKQLGQFLKKFKHPEHARCAAPALRPRTVALCRAGGPGPFR